MRYQAALHPVFSFTAIGLWRWSRSRGSNPQPSAHKGTEDALAGVADAVANRVEAEDAVASAQENVASAQADVDTAVSELGN